jgi:hypothetical protein
VPLSSALASETNQELTTKDTKGSTKATKSSTKAPTFSFVSYFVSLVVDFVFLPSPSGASETHKFPGNLYNRQIAHVISCA